MPGACFLASQSTPTNRACHAAGVRRRLARRGREGQHTHDMQEAISSWGHAIPINRTTVVSADAKTASL